MDTFYISLYVCSLCYLVRLEEVREVQLVGASLQLVGDVESEDRADWRLEQDVDLGDWIQEG